MFTTKKRIVYALLILVLTFSLGLGITMNMGVAFAGKPKCPNGVCHLIWDEIDQIFYCVGSAINCCCD